MSTREDALPTAAEMRALVPTQDEVFQRNVRAHLERIFEQVANSAHNGLTSHNFNLQNAFPEDLLNAMKVNLEQLGYKVTIDTLQVTEIVTSKTLLVDWSE